MALGIKNSWKYEKDLIYLYLTPIRITNLFTNSAILNYPSVEYFFKTLKVVTTILSVIVKFCKYEFH